MHYSNEDIILQGVLIHFPYPTATNQPVKAWDNNTCNHNISAFRRYLQSITYKRNNLNQTPLI